MVRVARSKSETGIYHAMLRGINRTSIFEDQEDREFLLERLKLFTEKNKYTLYAYCLMDNHVHLLIREKDDEISTSIKRLSSSYASWYNNKYDRCGHLFQERFKSEVVETDGYFLTVLRYIHQNPAQAGMFEYVKDNNWTSYSNYTIKPDKVDTSFAFGLFSDDVAEAKEMFIAHHKKINKDKCLDYENFVRLTDHDVRLEIMKIGIQNINAISHLDKANRDYVLSKLKKINGTSLRQLSRITGISKSVIDRAH